LFVFNPFMVYHLKTIEQMGVVVPYTLYTAAFPRPIFVEI